MKNGWTVTLAPLSNRMIELLTDMNEFDLFVRDAAQVELGALVVTEFEGNGLSAEGLTTLTTRGAAPDPARRRGPPVRYAHPLVPSLMMKAVPAWI